MHEVAVVAYDRAPGFELAIPGEVLDSDVLDGRYHLRLVAGERGVLRTAAGWRLPADAPVEALACAHTVIVAGWRDELDAPGPELTAVLRAAHSRGARIVSLCTGAFVLAAAGLLDGRRATTHWRHADTLARRYPRITVDPSVLYIDDGDILTSAGTVAGIDLCLHLVRRDLGATLANTVARRLVVAPHRDGGQAQYVEHPVPEQVNGTLGTLLGWMEEHYRQPVTVDALARRVHLSRRQFIRRFTAQTGTSPYAWLLHRRVLQARHLLESTDLPIETIAAHAGFGSAETLRLHFRRHVGSSPSAYRTAFTPAD
jgi:transcriptional regulator GlxA family with amidase domain